MFEQKVLSHLRKNFAVGSEDKNDIMFVGQRIKWTMTYVVTAAVTLGRSQTPTMVLLGLITSYTKKLA